MSDWYTPRKILVCVRLADRDFEAGVLLHEIMLRYPFAKATLPGKDGKWSANTHEVWCRATGLSADQVERRLKKLERNLGVIERAHGKWKGSPNVLFVRPTERTQIVWDAATTFEALDQLFTGDESRPLHWLWQAWPAIDGIEPKKAGAIAVWYEELEGKMVQRIYGKRLKLKPLAQDLLHQILKIDPMIADAKADDLPGRLEAALSSIAIAEDKKGCLTPVFEAAE